MGEKCPVGRRGEQHPVLQQPSSHSGLQSPFSCLTTGSISHCCFPSASTKQPTAAMLLPRLLTMTGREPLGPSSPQSPWSRAISVDHSMPATGSRVFPVPHQPGTCRARLAWNGSCPSSLHGVLGQDKPCPAREHLGEGCCAPVCL